jgi:DNA-directed RNA polymerase specialized sigma24 family protein
VAKADEPIDPDRVDPGRIDPDRAGVPSRFPVTRWTLVGRAGGSDAEAGPIAIAEIVRLYAPALRAHLIHRLECDEHRADDLLQGFLTDKVLEQRLIGYADPQRGRFRTFLLTALERYVIDKQRRAAARKRSPQASVKDIDEHLDELANPATDRERSSAFDLAWAREVVEEVLSTMHQQCEQTDRHDLWEVFDVRYLKPAMEGAEPEPHESIAGRLKLESAHQSGNLLITAKRMFTRIFMTVVSRYAADEKEVRDEVNDLWQMFATART